MSITKWHALVFLVASTVAIALVVAKGRRDAVDPMRCAHLVAIENRCCAEGQHVERGLCVGAPARCPEPLTLTADGCALPERRVLIAAGTVRPGGADWEADRTGGTRERAVDAFQLDAFEVTERAYAQCAAAGRCPELALSGEPARAVGEMTYDHAASYCAYRGGRLPTADEWLLAAAGTGARRYPWGDTGAVCRRAAWGLRDGPCGLGFAAPEWSGAHPDGATPAGVHDLGGNVSEWVTGREGNPELRGGSFGSSLATDLRTWRAAPAPPSGHCPESGARCAYDASPSSTPRNESLP